MSQAYLVSYGSSGLLGRFVSADPLRSYHRGDRVVIRSERGRELGTLLRTIDDVALPPSLRHVPGEIFALASHEDQRRAAELAALAGEAFDSARSLISQLCSTIEIVDLEAVDDPHTYVIHILRFGSPQLQSIQEALTSRLQAGIQLYDVTDPNALDRQAADEDNCGSCGSEGGGCGKCGSKPGGCSSGGSCGSGCGTDKEFHHQWKDYFADLRTKMENRKRQALLVGQAPTSGNGN
jgi:hypothetical protein